MPARSQTRGQGEEELEKDVRKGLKLFGSMVTSITFIVNQLTVKVVFFLLFFNLEC